MMWSDGQMEGQKKIHVHGYMSKIGKKNNKIKTIYNI